MLVRFGFPAVLLIGFSATAGRLGAQVEAFRYDSAKIPLGRVYHYLKTNRDGTHRGHISLYVAAVDRLESLKWSPGDTVATLVVARLDWNRFSVGRFESWLLRRGREPELRVALEADTVAGGVRLSLMLDRLLPISAWPWHSYDFDFASLNLALAHLRNPERPWRFQRADPNYGNEGPPFIDFGTVEARFTGREVRHGRPTRRYTLTGPGMQNQTGRLWAAEDGAYLVELEMPFPDEPGYTDVRVRLDSMEQLAPAEWKAYTQRQVSGRR
jgi:hypothetical protein